MKTFFKISEQTTWQILGKITTSLSMLFILSIVTRNYGPAGTGVFTLALTYLGFFYLLGELGVNLHILPQLIKKDITSSWQKLLGFRLAWGSVLTIVALVPVIVWPSLDYSFRQSIILGTWAVFFLALYNTTQVLFQSKLRYDLNFFSLSLGTIVAVGLTVLIIQKGLPVPYLVASHLLGWMVSALLAFYFTRKFLKVLPIFDFTFTKDLIIKVWPISLTLILNIVYFRLDVFILAAFHPFSDVGVYNVAYGIFQSALVLPVFIMNSFYPLMIKMFNENKVLFINSFKQAVFGLTGLSLIGIIFTFMAAPFIIQIIASSGAFADSETVLKVLSLGFPAYFISAVLMWTFIIIKKYQLMFAIYLIGLIFNGAANLIFIPQYSYMAAAIVTVVSEYLILALQFFVLYGLYLKMQPITLQAESVKQLSVKNSC